MILAIICIFIGAIFAINSMLIGVSSAAQQTVQYLGFVCSSVFIVGGFILLKLNKIIKGSVRIPTLKEGDLLVAIKSTKINYSSNGEFKEELMSP